MPGRVLGFSQVFAAVRGGRPCAGISRRRSSSTGSACAASAIVVEHRLRGCGRCAATTCPARVLNGCPSKPRDAAAGLLDDQARRPAMSHGFRSLLPEPVEPAGRDVAEVQRGRAQPPHRAGPPENAAEQADEFSATRVHVVRETRSRAARRSARRPPRRAGGAPLRNAPPPRSAVNSSSPRRVVDGRDLDHARRFRAPATRRRSAGRARSSSCRRADRRPSRAAGAAASAAAQLLGEHLVLREPLGDAAPGTSRSTARSTSVTRSIVPFLSTRSRGRSAPAGCRRRGARPRRPWRGTAGRGPSDVAGIRLGLRAWSRLTMRTSMPPSGAPQDHVVHEAAHEEDAAPAGLEEVLGRQRIGDRLRVEPLALVAHADRQFASASRPAARNSTNTCLRRVVPVPVLDRVDHRLANGDADPVHASPRRSPAACTS